AGVILALALVCFTVLNDGEIRPFGGLLDDNTGIYAAGDPYGEWIYAECDGEQQQITVLKDGQLLGVGGLAAVQSVALPDWCDLPMVDNQNLGLWEAKLARLNQLTATSGTSANVVLDAALDLPVSSLLLQPMGTWLDSNAEHGAELLDAVVMRNSLERETGFQPSNVSRENLNMVLNHALRQASTLNPDAEQIRYWLSSRHINSNEELLLNLARMNGSDPEIAAALLGLLDSLPQQERQRVYEQIAANLISQPQYASLLAQQLGTLSNSQRFATARLLLLRPDAPVEFAEQLLVDFDDRFYGEQAELDAFNLIADRLQNEPGAEYLLTAVLGDLADLERRLAAIRMVEMDRDGETRFTIAVLDAFDELHELSQPRVIEAILRSPQFADQQMQQLVVSTIDAEVSGVSRRELLEQVQRHPQAQAEIIRNIETLRD
ncbi:MAG: hypothetical protein WD772_06125, partial [Pseudohongiellaceae bacterium]